jgi:nitrite reductase/ring-hydroxylating ferredoxin subunit
MLTRVGPGTPMGNLLRRYWMPIAGASEFTAANPIKPVRLMGEDLTLYKDLGGRFGLVARPCPHRGADLTCGTVEEQGIRCFYHGWKFDQRGQCLQQPYEDIANPNPKSRDGCAATAYPVRELAGLLWAYMGPAPAPELPVWEPFTFETVFARSCSPMFPATGSSARRTPSIRCISNGCTTIGARGCAARRRKRRAISRSNTTNSSTALYIAASARAATKAIRTGRSAAWRCGRTAFISACISNGGCRSMTRIR